MSEKIDSKNEYQTIYTVCAIINVVSNMIDNDNQS